MGVLPPELRAKQAPKDFLLGLVVGSPIGQGQRGPEVALVFWTRLMRMDFAGTWNPMVTWVIFAVLIALTTGAVFLIQGVTWAGFTAVSSEAGGEGPSELP